MIGRIAVLAVSPVVDAGAYPARATAGELITVSATVFREGHDLVGATAILRGPGREHREQRLELTEPGIDLFAGEIEVGGEGAWTLQVEGWADPIASWRHGLEAKVAAGQDVELELEEGARLLERALPGIPKDRSVAVKDAIGRLRDETHDVHHRIALAEHPSLVELLWAHPLRDFVTPSPRYPLWIDRERAIFGAWYEMFPRSYGGLRPAAADLPRIAGLGFDTVYLPPIHPIGTSYRKGPNNALHVDPDDPGSPWAIGSAEGGHDAIHPELGDFADLDAFVSAARDNGLEVALDLALQCSPDHPWVSKHPEWFVHRPDGSIAYAENPPKKYQDIYPLNFDDDPEGLQDEVLRVVRVWVEHGIRVFRVDNPHTKPLPFWEWLIAQVKSSDPDVLFLAEAFTRPPMMHTLAKIGFTQSYTYFTWRNDSAELREYLADLTTSPTADYMRPSLWPNTPDILPAYLQNGGPPAFKVRALLAATLSPLWGMYSGFELYENSPVRPGSEEYRDSEKYQLRPRDFAAARAENRSLEPYLARLNQVRRAHPALQRLRGLTFHHSDDPGVLCYSRRSADDVLLVVVNLDPYRVLETTVRLDLTELGIEPGARMAVHDQLGPGHTYAWGAENYVRLDPAWEPGHLFVVTPT
ncbi:MAG TPA: alpha-1,4-glucan--maltose-1-phosphate maltosyltransferase [Mycobacteriales bacterium]|nr:alpha-1,4-glucan--maltose-1-phosphate maltosyltransferase [Mycobacteriales bacterium]